MRIYGRTPSGIVNILTSVEAAAVNPLILKFICTCFPQTQYPLRAPGVPISADVIGVHVGVFKFA